MRTYIESTIPSYVVARPARDLLQAARQQLTRDWWDFQRAKYELFTSQVVLDEVAFGERAMAQLRLDLLEGVLLLQVTDEVKALARKVLESGLLPATADRDATHIALASAYEMDILLSWNCRHTYCQRGHSGQTAKVGGSRRLHPPGNLHAGRIDGKRP